MRVLLLGAGGMLGRDLVAHAPPDVALTALDRAGCDVTDAAAVRRAVTRARPAWVLNAAAHTRVDLAETERDAAGAANAEGPGHVGAAAAEVGARVLHLGTDYVFPGTGSTPWREDDPTAPVNWYGATKLAGERALAATGAAHLVVRVQWLYGDTGASFPRTMLARARAGQATRVVADQWGAPTYTADLAPALWRLVALGAEGTLHLAAAGTATWHDVAARIFARTGDPVLLTPIATAEYPTPARRPAFGVLDLSRSAALGVALPPWEDALDRWLDRQLAAATPGG